VEHSTDNGWGTTVRRTQTKGKVKPGMTKQRRGNMEGKLMSQTVSTYLQWIAERAAESKEWQYYSLANHIDVELLGEAFSRLKKKAAAGVDGETVESYRRNLKENLESLHKRLKENRYRATPAKRIWLEKDDGGKRPIGMLVLEDKIVQRAVSMLLEPIYEEDFYDFSYGFRRGRNTHQALKIVREKCMSNKCGWIIDADIKGYFDTIDHKNLQKMIARRVTDGGIKRLIGKWLNAGVSEEGELSYPESGTQQGGSISPLLSNIYLHYVLDDWFVKVVQPRLRGKSYLIRFCDDFIVGCEFKDDAERIMEVLPKRMKKYGLTLHPEKTKLIDFTRPEGDVKRDTFAFLGFTHYWSKSRKGYWVVKRKTKKKKLSKKKKEINEWCRKNRHEPIKEQHRHLCRVLRGHFNYFGVICNHHSMKLLWYYTIVIWRKWLNRRGGKNFITWDKFNLILKTLPLPEPKIVHSI